MIARVAEHEDIPAEADEQYVARFRDLLCRQPGFRGRYHLLDPATGRALSAMLWEDEAALQALRARALGVAGGRRADQRRGPDDGARPRGGRGARAATR
jgi:heme-degrading monooxygenase HmoA